MSTNAFGLNPAPVGTTVTQPFTNPVIPSPVPSAGLAKGYSNTVLNTQSAQSNPILGAAAGPKCNIVWVESMDKDNELLKAKTAAIESERNRGEFYKEVIDALSSYRTESPDELDDAYVY